MHSRRFLHTALFTLAAVTILLFESSAAYSAAPAPPADTTHESACGTTAQEAIRAAEKFLASKDPSATNAAITCLAQGLKALEERTTALETGREDLLFVPKHAAPKGK